ncbi:MAG: LysR family transcriptional regulator [Saccharospirillum sp.]|uniref:LysR family transcriptional regulator n=1 Tax=Saccharospirillum sp. TaxID=2033801 RepID=UPI0032969826
MSPLDDLAFFRQLARSGSLTVTARELGVSLSTISKRLKQLEARLGVALAHRTTRRLTLTDEGELYLARGVAILDELGELEEQLASQQADLQGRLRINATFGFGRHHVAPLLSQFCTRHPALEGLLDLTNYPASLSDQGFDLGIRVGEPPDSRLIARRILPNRRVLCAASSYLEQAEPLKEPLDLTRHRCLLIRENEADYAVWRFEHRAGQHAAQSVKVSGGLASNDGDVIKRMALDGHGVLYRSWWHVHEDLARGDLIELLPEWQGSRADFYAVYPHRRHTPQRLRAFVEFLATAMQGRVPAQPGVTWAG